MKSLFAIIAAVLLLSPAVVEAQTRSRRTSSQQRRRSNAPAASASRDSLALQAARAQVVERIKVLTRFIYIYGGIANDIEVAEQQAQRGAVSEDLQRLTGQRKAALRAGLRDVRAGLDQLEQDFRTTVGFERYYTKLAGVTAAASDAEEGIAAGQFKQAGNTLVQIVNKLTDALAEM
ncbi:MAG TPA: hypothetical protein VGV59_04695 [Pyrinomonadaceae bacterium]|nr:hypothetical protein [Pyrinomonadaceae bacterium]